MLNTIFQFLSFARYNLRPPTTQNGQPTELQCDGQGSLHVNIAGYGGTIPFQWVDAGLGAQGLIKGGPGKVGTIYASNEAASGKVWLMIFDKATNATAGDAPKFQIPLPA